MEFSQIHINIKRTRASSNNIPLMNILQYITHILSRREPSLLLYARRNSSLMMKYMSHYYNRSKAIRAPKALIPVT